MKLVAEGEKSSKRTEIYLMELFDLYNKNHRFIWVLVRIGSYINKL